MLLRGLGARRGWRFGALSRLEAPSARRAPRPATSAGTAEDGPPADFSLAEFEAFRAKAPEPWQDYPEEEEEEEAEGLERILEEDGSDEDSDADEMYDSDAADADERARVHNDYVYIHEELTACGEKLAAAQAAACENKGA